MQRLCFCLFLLICSCAVNAIDSSAKFTLPVKNINSLINAVVDIFVSDKADSDSEDGKDSASGTGFVISDDGHILTSCHVIYGAAEIRVVTYDGVSHIAKVVGRDERVDLALLKIDTANKLPVLEFADSDKVQVTEPIIVIGNPFGFNKTVAFGIVSYKARNLSGQIADCGKIGESVSFMQIDAISHQGSSGGPVINLNGKVIAIVTAVVVNEGGAGLTFCISSNAAKSCIDQLKKYGKIKRNWIGLKLSPLDADAAEALGFKNQVVYNVNKVEPGSPAHRIGIKLGDIVVSIDEKNFSDKLTPEQVLDTFHEDDVISIQIMHNGNKIKHSIMVESRVDDDSDFDDDVEKKNIKFEELDALGIGVTNLTILLRTTYGIPDSVNGILVNVNGSLFVLSSVNQHPTSTVTQFKERLSQQVINKKVKVALQLYDPIERLYFYKAIDVRKFKPICNNHKINVNNKAEKECKNECKKHTLSNKLSTRAR